MRSRRNDAPSVRRTRVHREQNLMAMGLSEAAAAEGEKGVLLLYFGLGCLGLWPPMMKRVLGRLRRSRHL